MTLINTFIRIARSENGITSAMLSILNDTQKDIVDTMTMKLTLSQSLEYMKHEGHKMSKRTYYRKKKEVQDMKLERMRFIAKVAYEEQHLERIDRMELIENQMWVNYHHEKDPLKKVRILAEIVSIQPYISSYYEATKDLLERAEAKIRQQQKKDDEALLLIV
jgi:hypothetical protein